MELKPQIEDIPNEKFSRAIRLLNDKSRKKFDNNCENLFVSKTNCKLTVR